MAGVAGCSLVDVRHERCPEADRACGGAAQQDIWVQCDECSKWRKMPPGTDESALPDQWYCHMNPDPAMAAQGHAAPQEPDPVRFRTPQPCHICHCVLLVTLMCRPAGRAPPGCKLLASASLQWLAVGFHLRA